MPPDQALVPLRAARATPAPARHLPLRLPAPGGEAALSRALAGPRRAGLGLIGVFLGGFAAWGTTVPIEGGAVAAGIISPDGSRRTVQHLEGGIIAELRVRDGDRVERGQTLVVLESVQARTAFNALRDQQHALLAMQARLRAEQAGEAAFALPPALREAEAEAELRAIVAGQRAMLAARLAAHESREAVMRQRIEQSHEHIRGLEAQVESSRQQAGLIADELVGKEQLLRLGLVPRPEVLRLQRAQAEIEGRRGEQLGMIARARQEIGETRAQILALDAERADKVAEQLDKVRTDLATLAERLQASRDVLTRTVVTAPIGGTVVNLRFKTVEGVIRSGEPVLDIVPAEEALLIDARVAPGDIDVVQVGLAAQVHLSAYANRGLPRIEGVVRSVSADRLTDPASGQPYYLARVEVDGEELRRRGPVVELVSGMPAEVMIVTTARTLATYLLEPFRQAFRRGLREV